MKRTILFLGFATCLGTGIAVSQTPAPAPATHAILSGETLKWGPAPPALPAGAEAVVFAGNPATADRSSRCG